MSSQAPESGEILSSDGLMLIKVGNRTYPAKHVKQCMTCRSKHRMEIERAVINGMPYAMIIKEVVEPYADHSLLGSPTLNSVMAHVNRGHMPIPFKVQRNIIENRASELGRSVEAGEKLLADSVAIQRTVIQRGFEMLNSGEISPTMNDLMKALQLQASLDADKGSSGVDEDVWRDGLIAYMEIVRHNVSADVFQRIGQEMAQSPVLQELASRRRGTVPGEIEG